MVLVLKRIKTHKQFLSLYTLFFKTFLTPDHVTSHTKSILIEE